MSTHYIHIQEMINGFIIGGAQIIVGYPFDTIKTIIQNNTLPQQPISRYNFNQLTHLYRGVKYPALLSCGYNSGCFTIYTSCLDNAGLSPVLSGAIAGTIMGALSTPFEYYKVQKQTDGCRRQNIKYWNLEELQRWKPSISITTVREGLATACYFGIYEWLHDMNYFSNFINGGLSGCSSWLFTYPLDTIKTRRQALTPTQCKQLKSWQDLIMNDMRGLYKGLGVCLARAFLVNGVTFWLYEKLHKRPDIN